MLLNEPEPVIDPIPMFTLPSFVQAETILVVNSGIEEPSARM